MPYYIMTVTDIKPPMDSALYNAVGNVKQTTDSILNECNTDSCDALDHLTSWSLNSTTRNYAYDNDGNLSSKAGVNLQYNDAAYVHAVTSA